MDITRFDYSLPSSLIAQFPPPARTASRLLTMPNDALAEIKFAEIGNVLQSGDVLVANNTRVVPARLFAQKPSGGKVEIMLERMLSDHLALVQLRANKPIRDAQILLAGQTKLVVTKRNDGFFSIARCDGDMVLGLFHTHGSMPLPPYIARPVQQDDWQRYQTVYASVDGAVAAPTAGLHFSQPLINRLNESGIEWVEITLHVGAGTFQPVRTAAIASHRMHREWMEVSQAACARINQAKSRGGRVIAVGTTVVRALESAAQSGHLETFCGDTQLFIRPGYQFRIVDALLTNFHLPRSTLLMLVCAFAGYEKIMRMYQHASTHGFRFYSYGDAMFVERTAS